MSEISVIIVNYKTEEFILNCIDSIIKTTRTNIYEIIIVDNVVKNSSFADELKRYDAVKYIGLDNNKGFGYACNRGVENAKGKVLLFLNPDIIVKEDAIEKIYKFILSRSDAGFVTGVLTDEQGKLQYFYNDFPGLSWEFKQAYGISLVKTIDELNNADELKQSKPFRIDWAHGACLMINTGVFKKTKWFDENIFLYYEDVDIQKQVYDINYVNYCYPDSVFIHYERGSVRSEKGSRVYYFHMHYSKLYYMKKYFPVWKNLLVRLFYITGFTSKIIMLPFRVKYKGSRSLMISIYMMVIMIHLNLKKKL